MHRNAATFELARAFEVLTISFSNKNHDNISNGSKVIALTDKQRHIHTHKTDTTENNTTVAARVVITTSTNTVRCCLLILLYQETMSYVGACRLAFRRRR